MQTPNCWKVLYVSIGILLLNSLSYGQSGWFSLNSGTTVNIWDIQFLNQNTGYISAARKSTNGGISWFNMAVTSGLGLYFINVNTGWLVGYNGLIRRTTNAGTTWFSTQPLPYPTTLYEVFFIDANTGMIVGGFQQYGRGAFYYSTDGGNSWADRSPSLAFERENYDVYFFDANTGIVVNTMEILRTTDAGLSWNWVAYNGCPGVSFANWSAGFAAGFSNVILKTTNGGSNWFSVYSGGSGTFFGIFCIDPNNVAVVGTMGRILRTTDAGLTWLQQASGTGVILRAVHFIDTYTGWACGDNGTILKTTTGGFTAIEPISNEVPSEFKLHQNYPNPFNSVTGLKFEIARLENVKLIVHDLLGRELFVLVNEELQPGTYEVEFNGLNYPSGSYYYRLIAGDYAETKRFVLIK
jgi:photosystem II stability/assembly factor-like uncharacterized protein